MVDVVSRTQGRAHPLSRITVQLLKIHCVTSAGFCHDQAYKLILPSIDQP